MFEFARSGSPSARAPSLHHNQPSNSKRQVTKVRVPRTTFTDQQARQQKRGAASYPNDQDDAARPGPNSQGNGQGPGVQQLRDVYDTDTGSLDTTIPRVSTVPFNDSQRTVDDDGDGNTDSSSSEGIAKEDEEGTDGHGEESLPDDATDEQIIHFYRLQDNSPDEQDRKIQKLRAFKDQPRSWTDENSYPTTTSGRPDNASEATAGVQNADSDIYRSRSPSTVPSPPRARSRSRRERPEQMSERASTAAALGLAMHHPNQLIEKAAVIRSNARSELHFPRDLNAPQQSKVSGLRGFQPPYHSHDLGNYQTVPTLVVNAHQGSQHQQVPAVEHSRRPRNGISVEQRSPSQTHVVPPPSESSIISAHQTIPKPLQPEFRDDVDPIANQHVEDFDLPTLYQMSYEQLKHQEFDSDPRAPPNVLSEDMQQMPLPERLQHVRERLDVADQSKFFTALPIAEWEDAGDWFLEQFGTIIKSTKELRQKKRKLALEFEKEIEEQHERVSKKQMTVEAALDSMRGKGQTLIPKSPSTRRIKSPTPRG